MTDPANNGLGRAPCFRSGVVISATRVLAIFCGLIQLAGCAATDVQPETITPVELAYDGLLVGSFGFDNGGSTHVPVGVQYVLLFRSQDRDDTYRVTLDGKHTARNSFVEGTATGIPFAFVLPPGDYEFTGWMKEQETTTHIPQGNGFMVVTTVATAWASCSYPIQIRQGGIHYVGEVLVRPQIKESRFLGLPVRTEVDGPVASISDRWSRDLASFQEMYPTIRWEETTPELAIWKAEQTTPTDGIRTPAWFHEYSDAEKASYLETARKSSDLSGSDKSFWDAVNKSIPAVPIDVAVQPDSVRR